jgi:hypothetical protein
MPKVIDLPARGTLIAATDMQGNLQDFERIAALFEEERRRSSDTYLVLTGDLIHGPELAPNDWPEHLGSFYVGDSATLLERASELQERHPDHVHYLLGNHEHAHVGGPIVGKFFTDEAARLEQILGSRTEGVRRWLETWPLVAVASRAQLCLLHAAPHAAISSRDDIERIDLGALRGLDPAELPSRTVLGAILWARSTSQPRARAFLMALGATLTTAIHGHDVVREGFCVESPAQLCVSTSFGCHDGDKVYLRWDLSSPAVSALDVVRRGLFRLWPGASPIHLDASLRGA